ncbi:hypothetical protein T492DRAFT_1043049 [Pavlovales sp. CCMP2436]|nr:hypothetical protein T492DRAFT_1043049 [Pavlovales sp. CCMP2436]
MRLCVCVCPWNLCRTPMEHPHRSFLLRKQHACNTHPDCAASGACSSSCDPFLKLRLT